MSNKVLEIQGLEVSKGNKKRGFLKISEKPAGLHQIPMTVINGYGDGPTLVVNGGEHGSEYNGPAACLRLMSELDPKKISGRARASGYMDAELLRHSIVYLAIHLCHSSRVRWNDSRTQRIPMARTSILDALKTRRIK